MSAAVGSHMPCLQGLRIREHSAVTADARSVKAPYVSLVPLPSLDIDDVKVDFQMEVPPAEDSQ